MVAIEPPDNILSAIQEQLPMTSKLLIVPMILSLSIPALAADPPAAAPADPHHEAKDAKKKDKKEEKKDEKKTEEKKDEKK